MIYSAMEENYNHDIDNIPKYVYSSLIKKRLISNCQQLKFLLHDNKEYIINDSLK